MNQQVLIITGPVGVGKSSTADTISEILKRRNEPHALIDMDYLRYAFPRPKDDPFHNAIGIKNLASLWKNYDSIGIKKFIIPNVVESKSDIEAIKKAIPSAQITIVRLTASLDNIHQRLHNRYGRQDSNNLDWHLNRAKELKDQLEDSRLEDFIIDTNDKALKKTAEEILEQWLGSNA